MPIRKHKKYSRPRKMFDIALIKEEQSLQKKYGLKTRREIWKAAFAIKRIRNLAKDLITADKEQKDAFIQRQQAKGFAVNNIADVLGLSKEDYLKRRLQSVVVAKGFALTAKGARQLITHKHVLMNGSMIDSPSHLTTVDEEATLTLNIAMPEKKIISDEEKKILEKMHKGDEE